MHLFPGGSLRKRSVDLRTAFAQVIMPPPGFDPAKMAAAAGSPANDPWRKREAWRSTGPFTRANRFKGAMPGLGYGAGAFAIYLVYDAIFNKADHGHGNAQEGHH